MENNKDYKHEHNNLRKELWIRAWTLTASASNCTTTSAPTMYADVALKEFDERFNLNTES